MMLWLALRRFRDPSVPKLNNLRRAAAAGLRVPPTRWAPAAVAADAPPPDDLGAGPLIIRSGSPTEDQRTTSNAGQLLSLVVRDRADFSAALDRVIAALPRDDTGRPSGAVFVQPLVEAVEAGVAFFDGFYYERTRAAGGNAALTSGQARGDVCRGHVHALRKASPLPVEPTPAVTPVARLLQASEGRSQGWPAVCTLMTVREGPPEPSRAPSGDRTAYPWFPPDQTCWRAEIAPQDALTKPDQTWATAGQGVAGARGEIACPNTRWPRSPLGLTTVPVTPTLSGP